MVKGVNWLWPTWVQSCFRSFLTGQSNSWLSLNRTFLLVSRVFFCLFCFCCFCIVQLSNGGEEIDYIKCELISGGSARQFFLTCLLLALYYTSTRAMCCFL